MDVIAFLLSSPGLLMMGGLALAGLLFYPTIRQGYLLGKQDDAALTQFAEVLSKEKWVFYPLPPHDGGEGKAQIFIIPEDDPMEYLFAFTLWENGSVTADSNREAAAQVPLFMQLPTEQQWLLLDQAVRKGQKIYNKREQTAGEANA